VFSRWEAIIVESRSISLAAKRCCRQAILVVVVEADAASEAVLGLCRPRDEELQDFKKQDVPESK
jgi:hypothetical protein